jgi:exodeoxyribonuclease-5
MSAQPLAFSDEQAEAHDRIAESLRGHGVDIDRGTITPMAAARRARARRCFWRNWCKALEARASRSSRATGRGGGARTGARWRSWPHQQGRQRAARARRARDHDPPHPLHPVYDPEYEKVAEWLAGTGRAPEIEALTDAALDRARPVYEAHKSSPPRWRRRAARVGFHHRLEAPRGSARYRLVDEASMLDARQFEDLTEIFPTLVLFGDPAQLAPVGQSGEMVFDRLPSPQAAELHRIHRQEADNPILDLAHALGDPDLTFERFERMVEEAAARDDRVGWPPGRCRD